MLKFTDLFPGYLIIVFCFHFTWKGEENLLKEKLAFSPAHKIRDQLEFCDWADERTNVRVGGSGLANGLENADLMAGG